MRYTAKMQESPCHNISNIYFKNYVANFCQIATNFYKYKLNVLLKCLFSKVTELILYIVFNLMQPHFIQHILCPIPIYNGDT